MPRSGEELQKLWLAFLAHEKRASPNTLRAYGDDVSRFIGFQRGHLGGPVTEKSLAALKTTDSALSLPHAVRKACRQVVCSAPWKKPANMMWNGWVLAIRRC